MNFLINKGDTNMIKFISYFKLKAKLVQLGYKKAEIKSTIQQIRKFDKDIKMAVYYWVSDGVVPGDSDPNMVIDGKYSIRSITQKFDYSVPAAFIILQTYRKNPKEAYEFLYSVPAKDGVDDMSEDEIDELYKKWGIKDEDSAEESNDLSVDSPEN